MYRLAEVTVDLTTENVVVVGGSAENLVSGEKTKHEKGSHVGYTICMLQS